MVILSKLIQLLNMTLHHGTFRSEVLILFIYNGLASELIPQFFFHSSSFIVGSNTHKNGGRSDGQTGNDGQGADGMYGVKL